MPRYLVAAAACSLAAAACFPGQASPTPSVGSSQTAGPTPTGSAAALPDFVVVAYSREPAEGVRVPSKSTVRFHLSVKNIGGADYANWIVIAGPGLGGGVSGLKAGETKEAVLEWQPVCSSSGETVFSNIIFTVDPDNVTPEKDETNNSYGPQTTICV